MNYRPDRRTFLNAAIAGPTALALLAACASDNEPGNSRQASPAPTRSGTGSRLLAAYDTILLGSPIWNVRAPMIMSTFIEALDFTGKTVNPFVTYAVSGLAGVGQDYRTALPGTAIGTGLAIQGEEAADAATAVEDWLRETGLGA